MPQTTFTMQAGFVKDPDTGLVHVWISQPIQGVICETVQAAGKPWEEIPLELAAAYVDDPAVLQLCPLCFTAEIKNEPVGNQSMADTPPKPLFRSSPHGYSRNRGH